MGIVNDPQRLNPLRTVARALAEESRHAGMGLSIEDGQLVFFHRWVVISATKSSVSHAVSGLGSSSRSFASIMG